MKSKVEGNKTKKQTSKLKGTLHTHTYKWHPRNRCVITAHFDDMRTLEYSFQKIKNIKVKNLRT